MAKLSKISMLVDECKEALAEPKQVGPKKITLEQVRAVLAEKSQDGFTSEVRALLEKYGAKRLSEIDPANYQALLFDAEATLK